MHKVQEIPNILLDIIHEVQDTFHDTSIINFMIVMEPQLIDDKIYFKVISHPKAIDYRYDV